jgi:3-oxoacyl-[acyl-carrier protein] reductase
MIAYDLVGKTALVTGAASGIGLATAAMLGRNGARVAVNFLADDPRGKDAVARLAAEGLEAIAAPGNVGDAADCERMVKKAIDDLGRLDLLVANAGTAKCCSFGTRPQWPPMILRTSPACARWFNPRSLPSPWPAA